MEDLDPVKSLREWPASHTQMWPLAKIREYPRNPKTHSEASVRKIADSMRKFGVTAPVLVDEDGVLIYGHGRRAAAALLGLEQLPVAIAKGWSEDEKSAYRIADNQLTMLDGWDMPALKAELAELNANGFDLTLLGFDTATLNITLANAEGRNADAAAMPPAPNPVTRRGDIWVLGDHRLMCGDSTDEPQVLALYAGARPHLLVTDPPYGINYRPDWRTDIKRRNSLGRITNTAVSFHAVGLVSNDDQADWTTAWSASGAEVCYVWHAGLRSGIVERSLSQAGYLARSQIMWRKAHFALGRGDYHWQHENCLYAVRRDGRSHWNGDRKQTTVWDIVSPVGFTTQTEGENARTGHSTQKPVECMRRPIENNSQPGEGVYDPFVGSGTTIVAAELTGRKCFAMEIDPSYCDVALRRWQTFTASKCAELAGRPGWSFEDVAEERGIDLSKNESAPAEAEAPSAESAPAA